MPVTQDKGNLTSRVARLAWRCPAIDEKLMRRAIVLYDGLCGLCDRVVRFTLRHDRHDVFRFAPLQSALASQIIRRHVLDPQTLNTVVLVLDPDLSTERLLIRSDAALALLARLGAPWMLLAALGSLCPRMIRDRVYDCIARNRYRVFGGYESCPLPSAVERRKFLDE
jgi:predicted DCC family thiol-disulfide oxidoreductase YuxK